MIEFCCDENSKLGQKGMYAESRGCNVVRVTEANDVTTDQGLTFVEDIIDKCHGPSTILFAAMPCTGGSPWGNINVHKPGGAARLRRHIKTFHLIWRAFTTCARKLAAKGGFIAIEWPRGCRYWRFDFVIEFLEELDLTRVMFDGCMIGLRSILNGKPIKALVYGYQLRRFS